MDAITSEKTDPINCLPVELLVLIFLLSEKQTHKSKPYPHLHLSWVCRYWREIINGSPVFWTVIKFSPWKGQEFIRELISRSGSAELSVFSPDISDFPKHRRRDNEILSAFDGLLKHDGYRIKFLFITPDWFDRVPNLILGKILPALKVFKFRCRGRMEPLEIVQSAKDLQYLQISLYSCSSLLSLQPSFYNLKALHITFSSFTTTKQFYFTCLSLCSNLESLAVRTVTETNSGSIAWDAFHLPSVITLPNLISLCVNDYTFIDQLRAPTLKNLVCFGPPQSGVARQNYLILDEYDVSSVTNLSICGFDIFRSQGYTTWIRGSTGLIPWECSTVSLTQFETADQDVDLRGEILPFISSTQPAQFSVYARYLSNIGEAPNSSFLPKLLSKLFNLKALSIDPYFVYFPEIINAQDIESFRNFFKEIFDNLVSVKPYWFIVTDKQGHPDLLRILLELINACPSLSSLKRLTYRIDEETFKHGIGGHYFGDELVKFLRVRREAGYDTLEGFEMEGGQSLPEEWIAEAANLGTHIHRFRSASNERIYSRFWR